MLLCLVSEMEPRSCGLFLEPVVRAVEDAASCLLMYLHPVFRVFEDVFPMEIIPAQNFLQIRMNFSDGNHPYTAISSNQDEFL